METISFARGVPSPDLLPVAQISQAAQRALERDGRRILSYGTGGGYPPLRELIAQRHNVEPSQVVITNGSLQGFVFLVERLLSGSDEPAAEHTARPLCVVEQPTYDRPLLILRNAGAEVAAIAVDEEGFRVDDYEQLLDDRTPDLTYLIANFQNPSGATLSEERRARLASLLAERDLLILEDDPYGELYFDQAPPTSLFERDGGKRVIYASSFSKTVSPGMRVGYLVLPQSVCADLELHAHNTYISPNLLSQAIVAEFISSGQLEPNIERCRSELAARCDAMCAALDEHLPDVRYVRPGGGYFLWAQLPEQLDADALLPQAQQQGVTFVPGSSFGEGCNSSARLAFSFHSPDEIVEGVRRLARALNQT